MSDVVSNFFRHFHQQNSDGFRRRFQLLTVFRRLSLTPGLTLPVMQ
jgi:hypothetical protein